MDRNANPIEVQKYLKGIDYPASKNDVINCAKENGAPEDLIKEIQDIDDKEYNSPTEISEKFSH